MMERSSRQYDVDLPAGETCRTAYDEYPTIVCVCGTSMHDYPEQRKAHEATWHSPELPAVYSEQAG